jgi:hypothetical protein
VASESPITDSPFFLYFFLFSHSSLDWASLSPRQSESASGEAQLALLQMAPAPKPVIRTRRLAIDPPSGAASVTAGGVDAPVVYKGAFFCGSTKFDSSKGHQVQHLLSVTSPQSTICQADGELLDDIKASYAHLCHLGHWRWSFALADNLPPHIQAIRTYESIMCPAQ